MSQPQIPPATPPRPSQPSVPANAGPPYPAEAFATPAQPRHGARHGAATAGVWLIAIGLVFLARDWAGWSWGEAWPLFVIAAGGASLVTSLLHRERLDAGAWSLVWPIAWIAIGAVLLAATTDNLGVSLGEIVTRWWPLGLIAIGLWFLVAAVWPGRRRPLESLAVPLGPSPTGRIQLRFGGGVLDVGRAAQGTLLSGTFQGGVRYRTSGPDTAELEPDGRGWPMSGATFRWNVALTGEKPIDLRLDTGASRATIDLSELLIRHLELHSGAAETRVRLPRAAGLTLVRAETGMASLAIVIPVGVAARVHSTMALGRVDVDPQRYQRTPEGWISADYATAPNRAEIEIRGGMGSVTIR